MGPWLHADVDSGWIETMDFVIVGNPWHFGARNPTSKHQIAWELARQGHRVLWVNAGGLRTPRVGSGLDRRRVLERLAWAARGLDRVDSGTWVISPLVVPIPSSRAARALNTRIYLWTARRAVRKLNFSRPALVNFFHMIPVTMRDWKGVTVYYCVDRWDAFGRYDRSLMEKLHRQSCEEADIVIVSSGALLQQVRACRDDARLILHGVDYRHFRQALEREGEHGDRPVDLPPGRLVGFFGLLDERLDQELVLNLARSLERPEGSKAQVVLIGPSDVDVSRLAAQPNIEMLGPKPYSEIPGYLRHFDVCVIPYVLTEQTEAVNPIKLREMLAGGCPVVATALPEVARYAGEHGRAVAVAEDEGAFIAGVHRFLDAPPSRAERLAISHAMKSETWEAKVRELLALIEQADSA